MFENFGFLKSKFSIFIIGEYLKHGFIKVGEKKSAISAISETSALSIWPVFKRPLNEHFVTGQTNYVCRQYIERRRGRQSFASISKLIGYLFWTKWAGNHLDRSPAF